MILYFNVMNHESCMNARLDIDAYEEEGEK